MKNLLSVAMRERDAILVDIQKHPDPRYRELELRNEIIAKLGGSRKQKRGNKESKKSKIHELAKACIRQNGGRARVVSIYDYVTRQGVKVSSGTLKAYLHDYSDLKSFGRKGWAVR